VAMHVRGGILQQAETCRGIHLESLTLMQQGLVPGARPVSDRQAANCVHAAMSMHIMLQTSN
jgi:hypothetical protein